MLRNPLSADRLVIKTSLLVCSIISLSACSANFNNNPWIPPATSTPATQGTPAGTDQTQQSPATPDQQHPPAPLQAKVAILLPLSGKGEDTGQAMLNAAQLAMLDLNATTLFELIPEDTGAGAETAINDAIGNGASLILGPVFSDNTKTITPIALQHNISVVSFSNDNSAAVGNTFLMGFMPQTQVEQVLTYAASMGMKRIGLIAPRDIYGDSIASAYFMTTQRAAIENKSIVRYDAGKLPTADDIAPLKNGLDAVLIAASGTDANKISILLQNNGLPTTTVKRLGTGLWDQPEISKLPGLQGAWYAASSPYLRTRFENRYTQTYGTQPPRLASLAYDATALAIVLARSGTGFERNALINPSGFSGVDGIFRFSQNGLTERGLAILEINNGAASVIQDAPQRFRE
jgi:branched-chain amino acid transport system substrate-binding protein